MARSTFPCPHCSRKFRMAAHLGRHMRTHRAGGAGRQIAKPSRPAHRGGKNSGNVLGVMHTYQRELLARQSALAQEINAISAAISVMNSRAGSPASGSDAVRGGGRRATSTRKRRGRRSRSTGRPAARSGPSAAKTSGGRKGSIRSYIVQALRQSSGPMKPQQIASAVIRSGYKTKSKNLTKAVSNALPKVTGIRRLGFGKYAL